MNIAVVNSSSRVFVRPDTTWERDNEDLYVPEFIGSLAWTPVLFARISKPGRSIGARFGTRYYDLIGAGINLYPEDLMDGSAEGFACACCLDHSSFLPSPELAREDFDKALESCDSPASLLRLKIGGKALEYACKLPLPSFSDAIALASRYCYLRIGDLIAIELSAPRTLCTRDEGEVHIEGCFIERKTIDFKLIF